MDADFDLFRGCFRYAAVIERCEQEMYLRSKPDKLKVTACSSMAGKVRVL